MAIVTTSLSSMPLDVLRRERIALRRSLELERMRSKQGGTNRDEVVERLEIRGVELTDELIRRYSGDLHLTDSLLGDPYPRNVKRTGTRADDEGHGRTP